VAVERPKRAAAEDWMRPVATGGRMTAVLQTGRWLAAESFFDQQGRIA
jgi:hypothetical protein